jgi:uncharacterized protein (TIGR00255 family)
MVETEKETALTVTWRSIMIKSMTGYGQYEKITEKYRVAVEIKSVNHRYCDVSIKIPKKFNVLESRVRDQIKHYASRGKIDVYIHFDNYSGSDVKVQYNERIASDYANVIQKVEESFGFPGAVSADSFIRLPEVVSLGEEGKNVEEFFPVIEEAVQEAGEEFRKAREAEGANLQADILAKLEFIEDLVTFVEERSPQMIEEYRQKIKNKVTELLGGNQLDESTLATELIIYADKVCVDEETVRLRSHLHNMRETLAKEEPVGRKLDFISQEMNREANTILSKANDKELSRNAIDLKTEIEKIREQIQNIE